MQISKKNILLILVASLGILGGARAGVEPLLVSFDYSNVALDGGRMRKQFDEVMAYYMAIPNDNLLRGFRLRAGKPAPGSNMGGWYGNDTFNAFGQIISGLSRMAAASGDEVCRQKVHTLISEWAGCIAPDGFFFYSNNPNAHHYFYDKMVGGLLDAYLYAEMPEALVHLDTITTWAETNLARTPMELGGIGGGATNEWYTLSENLYRAYEVTGKERFRAFGEIWEYTQYWDAYANDESIFTLGQTWYHAYSHVNTLSGAAMAYRVSGEDKYLNTIRNAHDFIISNQMWATGGYGPNESFITSAQFAKADGMRTILDTWNNHFETQCGSWAIFKLSKNLITLTGEARYGDWIEAAFWNGIGASVPMSDAGEVQYYSYYHLGGAHKSNNMGPWTCCTGTRPQAVADYHDLIYFRGIEGALHVNLFTDSTVNWDVGGSPVELVQRTRFPEEDQASFTISLSSPATFSLALRIPGWLASPMSATVNGAYTLLLETEAGWAMLNRNWSNGDTVVVTFPMTFTSHPFPQATQAMFPAAINYGPLTMALKANERNPEPWIDFHFVPGNFIPEENADLYFRLRKNPEIIAKPYYAFAEGEQYYMYFDPGYKWVRVSHQKLTYAGNWNVNDALHYSLHEGNSATYLFEGTTVRFRYQVFDDAGYARITIDDKLVAEIDQYAPWRGLGAERVFSGLAMGPHTLQIEVMSKRNPASSNGYVNIAGVDYIPPDPTNTEPDTWAALD